MMRVGSVLRRAVWLGSAAGMLTAGAGCFRGPPPTTVDAVGGACESFTMAPDEVEEPTEASRGVALVVDTSSPMGGYLPTDVSFGSPYRSLLLLAPDAMARPYNLGPEETVTFATMGSDVQESNDGNALRLRLQQRPEYRAGSSDLKSALDYARTRVMSGQYRAVAILTDLVAAAGDEGRVGGGQAATALADMLTSDGVKAGRFGVGLLGVRTPYTGVRVRGCSARPPMGCRFSEDRGVWVPLNAAALVPVYLIVVGRDATAVDSMGQALRSELAEKHQLKDADVQWELMTPPSSGDRGSIACEVPTGHPPSATVVRMGEGYRCLNGEALRLSCTLTGFDGTSLSGHTTSWPTAATVDGQTHDALALSLSCEGLVGFVPPGDLSVSFSVAAAPASDASVDWSSWSTSTDDDEATVGRTLRLTSFTDTVRLKPRPRTVTCASVLAVAGEGAP